MEKNQFKLLLLILFLISTALFAINLNLIALGPTENEAEEQSISSETNISQNPLTSAWIQNGMPVCTESNKQQKFSICSDEAGGAIIAWEDSRTGNSNKSVYAQRISSAGEKLWNSNGVPICTNTSHNEPWPRICSDENGGAIITWEDNRNGNIDIFAQKINSTGNSVWTPNGVPVCLNDSHQYTPQIISDGVEGAFISWADARHDIMTFKNDIYAQRIDSTGDRAWVVLESYGLSWDGKPVCTQSDFQYTPHLCSDGFGGAIISWEDDRDAINILPGPGWTNITAYAQRIDFDGDKKWTAFPDGVPICNNTNHNDPNLQMCSDGVKGAIMTWVDNRSGNYDIYSQRFDTNGNPHWADNGIPICIPAGVGTLRELTDICLNGTEGAFLAWKDEATDSGDIYAQLINSTGEPQWDIKGVVISNAIDRQTDAKIVADGNGSAYIVWEDFKGSQEDIYAQYINSTGSLQWDSTLYSTPICEVNGPQFFIEVTSDGAGGAIIAWTDERSGIEDLYASKIGPNGIVITPTLPPSDGDDDSDDSVKSEVFDPTMLVVIGLIVVAGAISLVTGRTYVARKGGIRKDTGKVKDYLKQREEVVEDDIVLSKEKHFCLVHKGPIEGYNFICPTCGAYYCIRCVDAVKELENACWSCGKPLDPSQPIKSLEEEYDITPITEKESKLDATKGKSDNKKLKPKS